jgi:MFS family permease
MVAGTHVDTKKDPGVSDNGLSEEFKTFRRNYLIAFLSGSSADWLKGPYIYRLYEASGFQPSEITCLFAAGYASSAIFGLVAGVLADTLGRRRMCLVFCVLYAVHGAMHVFSSFAILLAARIISGVGTALLFSAFEAWMVSEHKKRFDHIDLSVTFSVQTQGNAFVAIVAGLLAQGIVQIGGCTAPFAASLPLLGLCALKVHSWPENVGTQSREIQETARAVVTSLNSTVLRVGSLQCLFEGSMHIFVFLWTPVLQHDGRSVPHGVIFTVFMICFYFGGKSTSSRLRLPLGVIFGIAAFSLSVPCFCENFWWNLAALSVFECCCGAYFPQIAMLRSKHFPEAARNATITLFRVPLNGIVVSTLVWGRSYPPRQLLAVASYALMLGAAIYTTLSVGPFKIGTNGTTNGHNLCKKED